MRWWPAVLGVVSGLLLVWAGMLVMLLRLRPQEHSLREALRLLPDLIRLLAELREHLRDGCF